MNIQFLKSLKTANGEELRKVIDERFEAVSQMYQDCSTPRVFPSSHVSLYRGFYDNDGKTFIEYSGGLVDDGVCGYSVDNTRDIMLIFAQKLKTIDCKDIESLMKIVTQTIYEYVGGARVEGDLAGRQKLSEKDHKLSSFKGSKNAWCQERTAMAHHIFKMLGLESEMVVSSIWLDNKTKANGTPQTEGHAYNLIRFEGNTYLFDSTLVDFSKDVSEHNSIVCKLPAEAFDSLINVPERNFKSNTGEDRVCYYNPRQKVSIIVDGKTLKNEESLDIEDDLNL